MNLIAKQKSIELFEMEIIILINSIVDRCQVDYVN